MLLHYFRSVQYCVGSIIEYLYYIEHVGICARISWFSGIVTFWFSFKENCCWIASIVCLSIWRKCCIEYNLFIIVSTISDWWFWCDLKVIVGGLTQPTVLFRLRSIRLAHVCIHGTRIDWVKSEKLARKLVWGKQNIVYPQIAWRWSKWRSFMKLCLCLR